MNGSSRPSGWMRVPPPIFFALPLLLGLLLEGRFPLVDLSASVEIVWRWLGLGLVAIGTAHALSAAALFARWRTTILPHRRATVLMTRGAYRWSRNPMYLGLTLIYLGVAAACAAVWPMLFLPLPLLVVERCTIPMEERQLEEAFGPQYIAYKARVRRWL